MSSIRGYLFSFIFLVDSSWTRWKRNGIINLQDQKYQRKTWIIENDLERKLFMCVSFSTILYFSNWKCWGGQLYETLILDGLCKPKYWIISELWVGIGYCITSEYRVVIGYWIISEFWVVIGYCIISAYWVVFGYCIILEYWVVIWNCIISNYWVAIGCCFISEYWVAMRYCIISEYWIVIGYCINSEYWALSDIASFQSIE